MIPVPNTELVTETDSEPTIISYHQGICKAVKLNQTGYMVWTLIDGHKTVQEITALFVKSIESFPNCSFESVHKDVDDFIIALENEGFIRLEPCSP